MIAHVDADSFFASVLVRKQPNLKGKPLLAVGMGGGCVIAASYEAKYKGVRTGMRLTDARKLCPGAIEMDSDFRETGIASAHIESILQSHVPVIEQMSIDEWYLDLRSVIGGVPRELLRWMTDLQQEVISMTALSVSAGVAPSKLLAKMAGEYRKPAGVTVVQASDIERFLRDRPAAAIPGIGRQRSAKTDILGWKTAWDVAVASKDQITRICGRPGVEMQRELLGEQIEAVAQYVSPPKSISRCRSFKATEDRTLLKAHLLKHLEYCTTKMRRWNVGCNDLSVWIRTPDFLFSGSHRRLGRVTVTVDELLGPALAALSSLTWYGKRFNQVGLSLYGFAPSGALQQSLFEDHAKVMAGERLQDALDDLHSRFGRDSVTRATALPVATGTTKDLDMSIVDGK